MNFLQISFEASGCSRLHHSFYYFYWRPLA